MITFFVSSIKGGYLALPSLQILKCDKRGSEHMKNRVYNKSTQREEKEILLPDTPRTDDILDSIYTVIGRMKPKVEDLTEFTELLTEFKKEVGLTQFKNGLQMGLRMAENEELEEEPETQRFQA